MRNLWAHSHTNKPKFLQSPREVVAELDKHIVGQPEAKRAVALVTS